MWYLQIRRFARSGGTLIQRLCERGVDRFGSGKLGLHLGERSLVIRSGRADRAADRWRVSSSASQPKGRHKRALTITRHRLAWERGIPSATSVAAWATAVASALRA